MSFRFKIALLTAAFASLPLAGVGWLLIDVNASEIETSTQALQIALAESVANQVRHDVREAGRTIAAVAGVLGDASIDEDARIPLALRLLEAESRFNSVAIYDRDGALIDRMRVGINASQRGREDARTPASLVPDGIDERPAVGAASIIDGVLIVPLMIAILANGETTGYLLAPLRLDAASELVERLSTGQLATREGVICVLDADGRALVHPEESALLTRPALASHEVAGREGASDEVASLGRAPISGQRSTPDGREWLVTSVGMGEPTWAVVAQVPLDVAHAPLDEMRAIVVSTVAAALLAAFIIAFLFARRLTAPIGQLVDFTKHLAARRFDKRIQVKSKDEIGVLAGALSDAAAELEESESQLAREAAIRSDLGRYLPAELVEKVIRREQSMELGGQRAPVTVLFADVVAFTPLTERLEPEQVVGLLNELFTLLTEAVFRHEGTVDKFVGDCVMAMWGAPTPHEDHAVRAVSAAQDMLRFLEAANAGFRDRYGAEVQLAIGVNSGDVVVGNVGSKTRMEYTAIGDVVNVAARLESIARPNQLLISQATQEMLGDKFECASLGERKVPGRSDAVSLFEVRW